MGDTQKEKYLQGDIILTDFGENNVGSEKTGYRPSVIISNNAMNEMSDNIIVAPLTNAEHKKKNNYLHLLPTQVLLEKRFYNTLESDSVLQLEDMRSVSKERVGAKIGYVTKKTQREINKAFLDALGIIWYGKWSEVHLKRNLWLGSKAVSFRIKLWWNVRPYY